MLSQGKTYSKWNWTCLEWSIIAWEFHYLIGKTVSNKSKEIKIHILYDWSCFRFLRRFSRCCKASMPTLTLARYILELSLMEYHMIFYSESKIACAALYLALMMKNISGWTPTLEYYSGYKLSDFFPIVLDLNSMLHQKPKEQLKIVRNKYSHEWVCLQLREWRRERERER